MSGLDIYNDRIVALAGDVPRMGRLDAPHATATMHSALCGSTVVVDVRVEGGRVVDYAQDVRACALGKAAASIVARHVIGATPDDLERVRDQVRAMLKTGGAPPEGEWSDCAVLLPVREFRARHASTLLAFDASARAARDAAEAS